MLGIETQGFATLQRALQDAPRRLSTAAGRALDAAAEDAVAVLRENTPVGETGDLRAGWHVEAGATFEGSTGRFRGGGGRFVSGGADLTRAVANAEPYAARINWGFIGTDALGRTYNQPGQFFVERSAPEIDRRFINHMSAALGDLVVSLGSAGFGAPQHGGGR